MIEVKFLEYMECQKKHIIAWEHVTYAMVLSFFG